MAKISIFGLGYVGAVSAAALADNGHEIIGVDINLSKVEMINAGRSPVIEAGLSELIAKGVQAGCIRAITDTQRAVHESDISIICVGTPSNPNGSLDLTYIDRVSQEIGASMATKPSHHTVIVRSTMLPGSTEEVVIPLLEQASGKQAGRDFSVCYNPEFLREGSAIRDFFDPPFTIIGSEDEKGIAATSDLYAMLDASLVVVPIKVAEMVKYACNAFHALKVTFANEIGNLCKQQGIDSYQVMDIFCQDTKLNISSSYLKPGFAFGGSCLPKDLRALLYFARHVDQDTPILNAIMPSNHEQIDIAYRMIRRMKHKRVGVLGLSFKAGTDDLRESPMVELVERLIGKGYQVNIYDKNVSLANLQGANRIFIEQEIPHITSLMCDSVESVLAASDMIVIGNNTPEFRQVLHQIPPTHKIIDLVRITEEISQLDGYYDGICW